MEGDAGPGHDYRPLNSPIDSEQLKAGPLRSTARTTLKSTWPELYKAATAKVKW